LIAATRRASAEGRALSRDLLLVTAFGLGLRVLFLLVEPRAEPMGDEPSWIALGVDGLATLRRPLSPFKSSLIFYPPAYPYVIGTAFYVSGGLTAVKWLQAIAGALLVTAVGRIGTQAFSPREGLVAATITAVYPDLIWFSTHFWSETLFIVLTWWGLERVLAADTEGRWTAAATGGLLWGLAILTRETALYFTPLVALWMVIGRGRPRARHAGAFLLAATLTVAPWTWRNWLVFHAFVPVSTFGPLNLWLANSSLPRDEVYRLSDSVEGPVAQYRLAWSKAKEAIRDRQPSWMLEKVRSEVPAFWKPESQALIHVENGAYGAVPPGTITAVRLLFVGAYVLVLALCARGMARLRPGRAVALLGLFVAYTLALHVVAFASDRFRLPVMPALFVIAAAGFSRRPSPND